MRDHNIKWFLYLCMLTLEMIHIEIDRILPLATFELHNPGHDRSSVDRYSCMDIVQNGLDNE